MEVYVWWGSSEGSLVSCPLCPPSLPPPSRPPFFPFVQTLSSKGAERCELWRSSLFPPHGCSFFFCFIFRWLNASELRCCFNSITSNLGSRLVLESSMKRRNMTHLRTLAMGGLPLVVQRALKTNPHFFICQCSLNSLVCTKINSSWRSPWWAAVGYKKTMGIFGCMM